MKETQDFKKFEELLVKKKSEILKHISSESKELFSTPREESGDVASITTHIGDLGSNTFRRELKASLTEEQSRMLREIDAAIKRIYTGEYGKCEMCGKEIDVKRLELIPWARLCIQCQSSIKS